MAQLLDGDLRALGQGILEATAGIGLAEVGQRQGEDVGREKQAGGQGGEAEHEAVLIAREGWRA
ncbi:hypothetical protein D3C84_1253330 [compost metagenome]